jgi:hypothetical protein
MTTDQLWDWHYLIHYPEDQIALNYYRNLHSYFQTYNYEIAKEIFFLIIGEFKSSFA